MNRAKCQRSLVHIYLVLSREVKAPPLLKRIIEKIVKATFFVGPGKLDWTHVWQFCCVIVEASTFRVVFLHLFTVKHSTSRLLHTIKEKSIESRDGDGALIRHRIQRCLRRSGNCDIPEFAHHAANSISHRGGGRAKSGGTSKLCEQLFLYALRDVMDDSAKTN